MGGKKRKHAGLNCSSYQKLRFRNLPFLLFGGSGQKPLMTRIILSRFSLSAPVELRSYVADIKFSTSSPAQRSRVSAYTPAYTFFACVSFSFTRNKAYSELRANTQSVQLWR